MAYFQVVSGFLVIPEIRVNMERKLKGFMGVGYLRNYLAHRNGSPIKLLQNFTRKCMAALSELCL